MNLPSLVAIEQSKKYLCYKEDGNGREAIDIIFESDISTLEKVYALDKLYNCNLMLGETEYRQFSSKLIYLEPQIRMISDLPIADSIVNSIASQNYGRKRIGTVFASKWCYFTSVARRTTPAAGTPIFVIYDKYAALALNRLQNNSRPLNYTEYANGIRSLIDATKSEYRDLDRYLWLLGQAIVGYEQQKNTKRIAYILRHYNLEVNKLMNSLLLAREG